MNAERKSGNETLKRAGKFAILIGTGAILLTNLSTFGILLVGGGLVAFFSGRNKTK
jgi:hypothetical protein